MRKLVLPIAVLALAGCGDDTENRGVSGGNAVGATAATGSIEERVARLEQRVDRIESTAIVVGPGDPAEGSEVPPEAAAENASGNQAGNQAGNAVR